MNDTQLRAAFDAAQNAVRNLTVGQPFLGAFGEACNAGYFDHTSIEYNIFVAVFANTLSAFDLYVDADGIITKLVAK